MSIPNVLRQQKQARELARAVCAVRGASARFGHPLDVFDDDEVAESIVLLKRGSRVRRALRALPSFPFLAVSLMCALVWELLSVCVQYVRACCRRETEGGTT